MNLCLIAIISCVTSKQRNKHAHATSCYSVATTTTPCTSSSRYCSSLLPLRCRSSKVVALRARTCFGLFRSGNSTISQHLHLVSACLIHPLVQGIQAADLFTHGTCLRSRTNCLQARDDDGVINAIWFGLLDPSHGGLSKLKTFSCPIYR